jgi:hypothetical protein
MVLNSTLILTQDSPLPIIFIFKKCWHAFVNGYNNLILCVPPTCYIPYFSDLVKNVWRTYPSFPRLDIGLSLKSLTSSGTLFPIHNIK